MMIPLSQILPNPFRDFELDPIDQTAVALLKASIEDLEFWGGICVRKLDDSQPIPSKQKAHWHTESGSYELVYGHHRLCALLGTKYAQKADLNVVTYDDVQMAKGMAIENATQRKGIAAATDAVAAAVRALGYELLTESTTSSDQLSKIFESSKARDVARGMLLKGQGLGEPGLIRFFNQSVSVGDIRTSVAILKQTGKMAEYLDEIQAKIAHEQERQQAKADAAVQLAEEKRQLVTAAEEAYAALVAEFGEGHPKAKTAKNSLKKARDLATRADGSLAAIVEEKTRIEKAHESAKKSAAKAAEQEKTLHPAIASILADYPRNVFDTVLSIFTKRGLTSVEDQPQVLNAVLNFMDRTMEAQAAKTASGQPSVWTKDRYEVTAKTLGYWLNSYYANNLKLIAEWESVVDEKAPASEKESKRVAKEYEKLTKGIQQLWAAMDALQAHVAIGGDLPTTYGTEYFFKTTWSDLQTRMTAFATAHAAAASIINQ